MTFYKIPKMSEKFWYRVAFPVVNRILVKKDGTGYLGNKLGFEQKTIDFYWDFLLAYWYQILWNRPGNPDRAIVKEQLSRLHGGPIVWDCSKWKIPNKE